MGQTSPLTCFASYEALQDALCALAREALGQRIAQDGHARVLCAGGQSPSRYLPAMARCDLDWSRVDIGFTDERWVPADHPDSNLQFVDRHLRQGAASQARLLPLHLPMPRAADALPELQARIEGWHQAHPAHDLVLLGMGADAHIASLFPGAKGVAEGLDPAGRARVLAIQPGPAVKPALERVTLTLAELARSRHLVLVIQGEAKRQAFDAAWHDTHAPHSQHPVSALRQLTADRAPQLHLWWHPE